MSLRCNTSLVPMPLRPMLHGFPTTFGLIVYVIMAYYANNAHFTPPISFKFILSLGFDQCYMSLMHMPIKPHMCHLIYVIHVYVIGACVNQACFTKFISSLCHLDQVYFTLGLEVLCIISAYIIKVSSLIPSLNVIDSTCHIC
jgi:hypothetical protein